MKAGDFLEFALVVPAFVVVRSMGFCTYSAGWCGSFAAEVVVLKAKAVGTLGVSIEAEVLGDVEATPKEEETTQAEAFPTMDCTIAECVFPAL